MNNQTTNQVQNNYYRVFDSMGRGTDIYIVASNIKEATQIAKTDERVKKLNSNYYKLRRSYNGGVMGSTL